MIKAVFDTNVLISIFLSSLIPGGGLSLEILHLAKDNCYRLCIAKPILDEVYHILLEETRIRKKYSYQEKDVEEFIQSLRSISFFIDETI